MVGLLPHIFGGEWRGGRDRIQVSRREFHAQIHLKKIKKKKERNIR